MTNEEAILYMKGYKATSDSAQVHTAIEMAIQALEKQIPKALEDGCKCPICGRYDTTSDTGYKFPYCPDCGQRLEYSND